MVAFILVASLSIRSPTTDTTMRPVPHRSKAARCRISISSPVSTISDLPRILPARDALVGQRGEISLCQTICAQGGNARLPTEAGGPLDPVVRCRRPVSGQQSCRFVVRPQGFGFGPPFAEHPHVDRHHVGEQGRAHAAMWRGEHSPDRRGKTVNGTQLGVGQCQSAEQTGQRHVLAARLGPARRRRSSRQRLGGAAPDLPGKSRRSTGSLDARRTARATGSTHPNPCPR